MNSKIAAFSLVALFGCLPVFSQSPLGNEQPTFGVERLAALRVLKINAGTITLLDVESSPTWPRARGRSASGPLNRTMVKMLLQPTGGSNINVEIWLPEPAKWNGRLLGLGNGGSGGHIFSTILAGPSASGYATVTTDLGTAPGFNSGDGNPEVWRDFGYRATHLMTVAARQVITAFYGRAPEYAYFSGTDTGGQQGFQEAQRYPEDYDGIVSNMPAHCRTSLDAYYLWNFQILKQCAFTKAQYASIIAAGIQYRAVQEIPQIAGKFVSDPRGNQHDIEAVVALAVQKDPTITREQAVGLRKLFEGPRHAVTGERIFNGIPFGSDPQAAHCVPYLFEWVFGLNKTLTKINFGEDIDTYTAALGPFLNAENADLSAFEKRGGKLLITAGAADSLVPYQATLDYYERLIEHFGSLERVQSFCELYLIPGMAPGGGPSINEPPNLLEVVRTWREKGTAPGVLTGRRVEGGRTHLGSGTTKLEMPLYPYPTKTGWNSATSTYQPVDGPRGGVERVAERFRPPAAE